MTRTKRSDFESPKVSEKNIINQKTTKPVSETQLQSIISKFNATITEYEIIDLEKYQGWSSTYLYLLVSSEDNFILKAKTNDQITGYDNEVLVSNALIKNGIESRKPILTTDNKIFYESEGLHWNLMTYIPGAQAHVNEYDENTIKSLAEHLNQYIIASFTNDTLKNLKFSGISKAPLLNTLDQLMAEKDFLEEIGILEGGDITELYATIKEGYPKFLEVLKTESIIHNDINPRNILMDHKTKNVVSLIDWDHVTYGNPLKDLSDSVGVFYDNLDFEKATKYKKLFYKSFTSEWFTTLESISIDYAFWYYYTVGKWQAILFYLDLLRKYDNKYGERDRFIMEMKNNYSKWRNVILSQAR